MVILANLRLLLPKPISPCKHVLYRTDRARLLEVERVKARAKLQETERKLSGILYERGVNDQAFALITVPYGSNYHFFLRSFYIKRMSQPLRCGILIFEVIPHSIRNYLSSATNEKSENCASCENGASCANSDHSPGSARSTAAPESEIVPAQW